MKQSLLIAAMTALGAAAVSAATPAAQMRQAAADRPTAPVSIAAHQATQTSSTLKSLPARARMASAMVAKSINPHAAAQARPTATASEGMTLFEDFEGWDGTDISWLPQGWTMESKGDASLTMGQKWAMLDPTSQFGWASPVSGKYYIAIGYATEPQDEWLTIPEFTVEPDTELSFHVTGSPFFFFNLDYIDWDTYEFSKYEAMGDLEVLVKPEGATDFTTVFSWTSQFEGISGLDLITIDGFRKYTVPLSDYEGQTVSVAFRYVAVDCNGIGIDDVSVGLPSLEDVAMGQPFETLYWGFDSQPGWGYIGLSVAAYPVFAPITWTNNTWIDGATYFWQYHDPITNDIERSDEQDALTVTYLPDFTSDFTKRNNLYYPPELHATKPGASEGVATLPYSYLQAGGAPDFETNGQNGKEMMHLSLMPFDVNTSGFSFLTLDEATIGDPALPVFGYNENSDRFWINYIYNGEEPEPGDWAHLDAIINFIYPSAGGGKLVVEGVNMHALGTFAKDAKVTFEMQILPVGEDYVPDRDHPIASATCDLSSVLTAEYGSNDLLTIPFTFDEPAVLDDSNTAYVLRFSGFRNEGVTYFLPCQSYLPHPDYLCHGWYETSRSITGFGEGFSYSPIANFSNEYGDCYGAFAMGMRAWYPYLNCNVTEVTLPSDGTEVEVPLESYYDGAEYTITGADKLNAKVTGRYNDAKLVLSATAETPVDNTVTISAPGVTHTVKVLYTSGITDVTTPGAAAPAEIYTPDGRRVSTSNPGQGVRVIRHTDGTVSKQALR